MKKLIPMLISIAGFCMLCVPPVLSEETCPSETTKGDRAMSEKVDKDFVKDLKNLISLNYDAIAAQEAAVERLENKTYKDTINDFKRAYEKQNKELSAFLREKNETPPTGPDMESYITEGKVLIANLFGDRTILRALKSNALNVQAAYERINDYEDIPTSVRATLQKGLQEENRHLGWFRETIQAAA